MDVDSTGLTKENLLLFCAGILVFLLVGEAAIRLIWGPKIITNTTPDGLYYLAPNQRGWYSLDFPIATNRFTYRGPDIPDGDLASKPNVIFLGDSFTFGWLLRDDQTIPAQVQSSAAAQGIQLNGIDAAMGGYGTDHLILRFAQIKSNQKNRAVVFILTPFDVYRQIEKTPATSPDLLHTIRANSAFLAWLSDQVKIVLAGFKKDPAAHPVVTNSFLPATREAATQKLLTLKKMAEDANAVPLFVIYEYYRTDYSNDAATVCAANKLNCITSVPEILSALPADQYYCSDHAHPSAEANRVLADAILQKLVSLGALPLPAS